MNAHWTVEMLEALPDDGQRYEVIEGERFVIPPPTSDHQDAVARLFIPLDAWQPDPAHAPFTVDLVTYFAEVLLD